ncbi:amino acid transporter [Alpinimonas psychrophila]|uniref:Amino acid transporter n=1 Tax=Alpinimonas psychrophila TaxID=748908 RepID=A0A7W3JV35_9MICO|nr:amino acid transporter [Alpinimonas psychrophila]
MSEEDTGSIPESKSPKRWIIGDPLPTAMLEGELLPKRIALPIFASDPLSSVAYAPQELLMILLIGGLAFLSFAPWIAACVILLMVVVVASYRQLVKAYPSGGGDYEVAHKNLGEKAGVVVASALLVDYIMTVAVSVASGVDNIISALPWLAPERVWLAVGFVVILAAINLRGVRESGKAFAIPTYFFVASVFVMIVVGIFQTLTGNAPIAESANYVVQGESVAQAALILLLLRSFASGCAALTGVEAIANGVPAFRVPKIKNAQTTLVLMGGIAITLFAGLITMAIISGVHYAESACHLVGYVDCETVPQRSLMAQIASATFGNNTILFFAIQAGTALVLLLAANTAFNGFPLLGSVLAKDGYAPKALETRGDRLIYSNGVLVLALMACIILIVYQADLTQLIQLYIIGVFISFTLGQSGMVVHWIKLLKTKPDNAKSIRRSMSINITGAIFTGIVLIVVTITKFTHGAWLVFAVMPILYLLMLGVNRYYRDVAREIEVDDITTFGAKGDHAIVLVGKMQKPILKALDYAIAARHRSIEAVHVSINEVSTAQLELDWIHQNIHVPLRIINSPYRDLSWPLIQHIREHRAQNGSEIVTVYLPQYIVGHWWEHALHNHKSRRLKLKLMLEHGVAISLVPWLLDSSDLLYGRRSRAMPGESRRGEPKRPVPRKPLGPASKKLGR